MEHVPLSEREFVWACSVKLLEQYNMMLSNPFLERFYWHAPYFQQWQAFIYVLDTLRSEPLAAKTSQTWKLVGSIFENTPYLMSDMRKPIHVAICNLCLKAYDARENALQSSSASFHPAPAFIDQLRQQREMAVAKQRAQKGRQPAEKNSRNPYSDRVSQAFGPNATPKTRMPSRRTETNHLDPHQALEMADCSSLDYFGFFEDSRDTNDAVIDFDFTFPDDYHLGNTTSGEAIDWEQWDSWLAESNLISSSS